jgi:hypothetical protein
MKILLIEQGHCVIKLKFYFSQGHIQDIGHYFWFENKQGIKYSDKDVKSWPTHHIDDALKSGDLIIKHEQVHTTPLIIDRMIEALGCSDILGPEINKQLEAYKQLRQVGIPHYHGQDDRWNTVSKALRDLAKIETNGLVKEDLVAIDGYVPGAWESFMGIHHDNQASLSEYKTYLSQFAHTELTKENMRHVGINPETGYPIRNFDFAIDLDKSVIIDVPDRYIEHPVTDPIRKHNLWILPLQESFKNATLDSRLTLLFRAAGTGRIYHLATAQKVPVPARSGLYEEFYNSVSNAYHSSGIEFPEHRDSIALIGNGPYPLFDLRAPNQKAQSLNVPSHVFEGMISPKLAGFKVAPRGVIIRDDGLKISKGPIILQETLNGQQTGWQYDTSIEEIKEISLEDVKKFSPDEILKYGFSTLDEAIDRFSSLFTSQKKNPKDLKNIAMAIAFGTIDPKHPKRGMMFFKPDAQVISCVKQPNQLEGPL